MVADSLRKRFFRIWNRHQFCCTVLFWEKLTALSDLWLLLVTQLAVVSACSFTLCLAKKCGLSLWKQSLPWQSVLACFLDCQVMWGMRGSLLYCFSHQACITPFSCTCAYLRHNTWWLSFMVVGFLFTSSCSSSLLFCLHNFLPLGFGYLSNPLSTCDTPWQMVLAQLLGPNFSVQIGCVAGCYWWKPPDYTVLSPSLTWQSLHWTWIQMTKPISLLPNLEDHVDDIYFAIDKK